MEQKNRDHEAECATSHAAAAAAAADAEMSLVGDHSFATLEEIVCTVNAPAASVHGQDTSQKKSLRVSGRTVKRAVYVV